MLRLFSLLGVNRKQAIVFFTTGIICFAWSLNHLGLIFVDCRNNFYEKFIIDIFFDVVLREWV